MYTYVAFLALFQAPPPPSTIPLTEDCSDGSKVLAHLAPNAAVEVRSSVAGNAQACYAVTATIDGNPIRGYVLGNDLVAIAEFERERAVRDAAFVNLAPVATAAPMATATPSAIPQPKVHYPPFADFSGTDMKGKPVRLRNSKGKVILVCFWSPSKPESARELLLVTRLYGQFKKQGVDVFAVTVSGERGTIADALDDFHIGFPNIPNGGAIAAKYNITYDAVPRTYVLNEDFEIFAAGLHNKSLEAAVQKLVNETKPADGPR